MDIQKAKNSVGKQTVMFDNPPVVAGFSSIAGEVEGDGNLGKWFDTVLIDDLYGTESWEKAESKMFETVVKQATAKANLQIDQVELLLGGDLLNQIISANYAARQLSIPFFGLYGACSTMAESLILAGMLVSGGYYSLAACASSSHFCSAERQYRYPLEYGNQRPPSSQRTVTGTGCTIISTQDHGGTGIKLTCGTVGKVVDYQITDSNNMGAAMAPAAADTICTHFLDTDRSPSYYDMIVTGDLGIFGSQLADSLCATHGFDIKSVHFDCGASIFTQDQRTHAGGSGCGCCASVLNSYLLKQMQADKINKLLFVATGALMSPQSSMQGESIPGIAHAVVFEK